MAHDVVATLRNAAKVYEHAADLLENVTETEIPLDRTALMEIRELALFGKAYKRASGSIHRRRRLST